MNPHDHTFRFCYATALIFCAIAHQFPLFAEHLWWQQSCMVLYVLCSFLVALTRGASAFHVGLCQNSYLHIARYDRYVLCVFHNF